MWWENGNDAKTRSLRFIARYARKSVLIFIISESAGESNWYQKIRWTFSHAGYSFQVQTKRIVTFKHIFFLNISDFQHIFGIKNVLEPRILRDVINRSVTIERKEIPRVGYKVSERGIPTDEFIFLYFPTASYLSRRQREGRGRNSGLSRPISVYHAGLSTLYEYSRKFIDLSTAVLT